jgi:hypothetical protein
MASSKSTVASSKTSLGIRDTAPFPFLDLPAEIRLMVYERLPVKVRHRGDSDLALVSHSLPDIAILATCRLINYEAWPVFHVALSTILAAPLRLMTSNLSNEALCSFLYCLSTGFNISNDPVLYRVIQRHQQYLHLTAHVDHGTTNSDTTQNLHIAACSYSAPELIDFRNTALAIRSPHCLAIIGKWDVYVRPWYPATDGPLMNHDHSFAGQLDSALRIKADREIGEGEWNGVWVEGEKDMRRMF